MATAIEIIVWLCLAAATGELALAFVYYPLRVGKTYYNLRRNSWVFRFDVKTGYGLRRGMVYSSPIGPYPNAPRKIVFNDIRTDPDGFLTHPNTPDARTALYCLGGSTTACFETRHDQTYPARLNELLRPNKVNVVNAGVGGYRSIHELHHLRENILPRKPWGVILFSGYNDFEDCASKISKPYDIYSHCLSHYIGRNRISVAASYSALWTVMRRGWFLLFKARRTESGGENVAETLRQTLAQNSWLEEWRKNVKSMATACKDAGVEFFILSMVSPCYPNAPAEARAFADKDINMSGRWDAFCQFVDIINEEAEKLSDAGLATVLDIRADFERSLEGSGYVERFRLFTDRMHFTEDGAKVVAQCVAKVLAPYLPQT